VHLHGALSAVNTPRPVIEEALRQAGGEWGSKKGKEHQAVVEDITPKWATYCTKDASRTSKALGIANVLSVTSGLEKQGPELWEKIRRSLVS
jgi:hypothetical protein